MTDPTLEALLTRAHELLSEIYDPAGVLMFWSSRVTYLDDRRPCDLVVERDLSALLTMCNRLDAIADGAIL